MTIPCVVPDGPLGVPPFEKPSIAKVIFVVYKPYLIFNVYMHWWLLCIYFALLFLLVYWMNLQSCSETSLMWVPVTTNQCNLPLVSVV